MIYKTVENVAKVAVLSPSGWTDAGYPTFPCLGGLDRAGTDLNGQIRVRVFKSGWDSAEYILQNFDTWNMYSLGIEAYSRFQVN